MNELDKAWIVRYDEWREKYDEMSYDDMQEFYNFVAIDYPEQNSWSARDVVPFFKGISEESLSVLELGGWKGELANTILKMKWLNITAWSNFEIAPWLHGQEVCKDERYILFVPCSFFWNLPIENDYNVFVASHVIEHLSRMHLLQLMEKLKELDKLKYIYIQAPLPLDKGKKWERYRGAHKLDMGWLEVYLLLRSYGWKDIDYRPGAGVYAGVRK